MRTYTYQINRDIDADYAVSLGIAEIDGSVWRFKIPYKDPTPLSVEPNKFMLSDDIPIAETRREIILSMEYDTDIEKEIADLVRIRIEDTVDDQSNWENQSIAIIRELRAEIAALTTRVGRLEKAPRIP